MIDKVAKVLKGKTDDVVASLQAEMDQFADELRFEDAAKTRDRLRALSVYNEKQKVVEVREIDRDIIALALKGDDACGVVFKVRNGKVLGSHHYYLSNVEGKEEQEVLESLLERYYLENEDVPGEISLSSEVGSPELIQAWLSVNGAGP